MTIVLTLQIKSFEEIPDSLKELSKIIYAETKIMGADANGTGILVNGNDFNYDIMSNESIN